LRTFLAKMYEPQAIQEVIDSIPVSGGLVDGDKDRTSYKDVCCSPLYSKATMIGIVLAIC